MTTPLSCLGIIATLLGAVMGLLMVAFGCGRARESTAAQKRAAGQAQRCQAITAIMQWIRPIYLNYRIIASDFSYSIIPPSMIMNPCGCFCLRTVA